VLTGNSSGFRVKDLGNVKDLDTYAEMLGYVSDENGSAREKMAADAQYTEIALSEADKETQKMYIDQLYNNENTS
jgi:hypothetical protein